MVLFINMAKSSSVMCYSRFLPFLNKINGLSPPVVFLDFSFSLHEGV